MLNNRRQVGDWQYTVPSPDTYPYQWLWDSCFHAIILSFYDTESAKKEILSLLTHQFPTGLLPHIIYWGAKQHRSRVDWGTGDTSSITQPPMLAYAAWRIFEQDNDDQFLDKIYQSLFHYYKYLINDRDPHERHLIGIINPDESGEDNSPRFDKLLDLPPVHSFAENLKKRRQLAKENQKCRFDAPFCMKNFFWVKDVPFNVIMAENLQYLARIAEKLERGYDAKYWRQESEKIVKAMRSLMFEDGIFWPTYGEDYKKIKVKTWAIFSPMFASIYTKKEADYIVKNYLLNPEEFWTDYPVPSTALSEPSFDPNDTLWRGPSWIGVNWFIFKGLLNYGYNDIAQTIKEKSIAMLEKSGFREHFNPFTAAGQGARNFTWGGLVIDMA